MGHVCRSSITVICKWSDIVWNLKAGKVNPCANVFAVELVCKVALSGAFNRALHVRLSASWFLYGVLDTCVMRFVLMTV